MCDSLVALPSAADGTTLFAKNSDRPATEAQDVEWLPSRTEATTRTTYVEIPAHTGPTLGVLGSRPRWMWGLEHGVNTAGVAAGNERIITTLDPRGTPPALTGMDLVRLALERAATSAEAVEVITTLIEGHGQGGSGLPDRDAPYWSSFLVADPQRAFVLETSGTAWAVEEVPDVRATSNRTTIADFDAAHRHPRQPVDRLVDPRWHASQEVLAHPPVTAAGLQAHLRSHVGGSDGWTVCMHAEEDATTASLVATLPEPGDGPPIARVLLGSPCHSVYVPLVVGPPLPPFPAWERFAALDATHRERLDVLEAALEADLATHLAAWPDGEGWNHRAVGRVDDAVGRIARSGEVHLPGF